MSGLIQQAGQWLSALSDRLPELPGLHKSAAAPTMVSGSPTPAVPPSGSYLPPGSPALPTPRAFQPLTRDEIQKRMPVKELPKTTRFSISPDEIRKNDIKETIDRENAEFISIPWNYNNLLDPFGH